MSYSAQMTEKSVSGGVSTSTTNTITAEARQGLNVSIADGEADVEYIIALDVSETKYFYLSSTQDLTFDVNDSGGGGGSIALTANLPYVFYTGKEDSFVLGTDIASVFLTNGSGSTAVVVMEALSDPTP